MATYRRRVKKLLLAGLFCLLILSLLTLVFFSLIYTPEYVFRVVRWGDSDVYDYQKFPERKMTAAPHPFHFLKKPDEKRVSSLFQKVLRIDDFDKFLAEQKTQAFLVIQNDALLYEKYFQGCTRESIVTSFSTAKSFTSALIGIALSEGHLQSIRDPVTKYLPELARRDSRFSAITIRHLLMMSAGLHYDDYPFFTAAGAKTYYFPDLRRLALEDTKIIDPPGKYFLYNNYHPLMLGLILERATQRKVADYLREKIWRRIGMEFEGSWSLDSRSSGFEKMESGINARAIDFAKFGRLFMRKGNWEGTQVIPASWVEESTEEDTALNRESYYPKKGLLEALKHGYYKYMWWGISRGGGSSDFFAMGNHGQFIYVSPAKSLIILRNGARFGISGRIWIKSFSDFASGFPALEGGKGGG